MNDIICRKDNGIYEIELDRPSKKNALTESMYIDITNGLIEAEEDPEVRVILIYGQPFCFTAGNDLKDFIENPPLTSEAPTFVMLRKMANMAKPIVLAINGPAVGIGTTMCLHADLVYCGDSSKFQLPFARLGLVPEFASSYLIPRLTGHVKAFELLVLGDAFNAQTAQQIGMVNEVLDDENYITAAKQKALDLAALPTEAVQESKRLLKRPVIAAINETLKEEADVFSRLLVSPAAKEKFAAFLKK